MSMSDPISDMLTRLRNAGKAGHVSVAMSSSKMKAGIAEALKRQGYIADYKVEGEPAAMVLSVALKYHNEAAVIAGLERISKPSRRVYTAAEEVPRVRGGLGISILSTSAGILTGKEAKKKNVGGEVLCHVW